MSDDVRAAIKAERTEQADLLLVACGRRLPAGRLEGAAAERFTRVTS